MEPCPGSGGTRADRGPATRGAPPPLQADRRRGSGPAAATGSARRRQPHRAEPAAGSGSEGMRLRLARAALGLYPLAWRRRYGKELVGLIEETPPSLRGSLDLLRGAADAHLHPAGLQATAADRMRNTVAATLCCWIAFVLAGCGFAKLTEDCLAAPVTRTRCSPMPASRSPPWLFFQPSQWRWVARRWISLVLGRHGGTGGRGCCVRCSRRSSRCWGVRAGDCRGRLACQRTCPGTLGPAVSSFCSGPGSGLLRRRDRLRLSSRMALLCSHPSPRRSPGVGVRVRRRWSAPRWRR